MKTRICRIPNKVLSAPRILLSFACSMILYASEAALASNSSGLVQETPQSDSTSPQTNATSPGAVHPILLYGHAHKKHETDESLGGSASSDSAASSTAAVPPTNLSATSHAASLKSEDPIMAAFQAAAEKVAKGFELNADDYRSLQVGISGYESIRPVNKKFGKINKIYRDSPAAKAGFHLGDKEVWTEKQENAGKDPNNIYLVQFGIAGTPVTVTLWRKNHPVAFTLIRMNIEDIQEPDVRAEWEGIVRDEGFKTGMYVGKDVKNLKRVESKP